jgi:CSLREA domain-containing protein
MVSREEKKVEASLRSVGRKAILAVWLATVILVLAPALTQAQGKAFTVNSTADAVDAKPGDGVCRTAAATCTLRAAIQEANAQPPGSTITLPPGTFVLTIPGADEDASATGDLDITKSVAIFGAGMEKTIIDGNAGDHPTTFTDRVLEILPSAGNVSLAHLTVQHGSINSEGAGLANLATLTLTRVAVVKNYAGFAQGNCNDGGGIASTGTLKLADSVVNGNGAFCDGPGIWNYGAMELRNVTVSNNGSSEGDGGGIFNYKTASAKLTNVTVSGNSGFQCCGGIQNNGAMTLTNVTISGNTAMGCAAICEGLGAVTTLTNVTVSGNHSYGAVGTLGVSGPVVNTLIANNVDGSGNVDNVDPFLGPLANNGGPTLTHALLVGSPNIDNGTNAGCPSTDQRGVHRPLAGSAGDRAICDIGAYEFKRS